MEQATNETTNERGPQIGFYAPQELLDALEDIRVKTGLTKAHLGREGLWQQVKHIRETHPAFVGNETAGVPA